VLDEFQFNDNIYIVLLHTGWSVVNDDDDMMYIVNSDTLVKADQLDTVASNENAQISFLILPCLAPNALPSAPAARCVSFQPEYKPGYYLRHSGYALYYDQPPSDSSAAAGFNSDASFIMRPDYWIDGRAAFQSVNYPLLFLHVPSSGAQLKIESYDGSSGFEAAASFLVTARPDPWPPVGR
jgi:hypothetical protein